ncbi:hypothetical protein K438DRAFT_1761178 [Mycena galopus ATCC 62051]|nr:hypothetical protein K438DRAFT_1761178 [Mycena galopus ATCC 62051]
MAAFQNPANLLDTAPYSSTSDDDEEFLHLVPDHLAHHNNLSPHAPSSPTLAWLLHNPPSPVSLSPPLAMATPTPMPARGDRNAPQFDSTKLHELRRYFTDLEFLLTRAAIASDAEKKQHATRFLSVEDQKIWEGLPTFTDQNKMYAEFKSAVLKLYAGNNEEHRFELSDLDSLIGQYSCFLRISTYLMNKNRLSTIEQSRAVLRAMQPSSFKQAIRRRLEIKKPDVHPGDVHALTELYEAAKFILAGTSQTSTHTPFAPTPTPPASAPAGVPTIEIKSDPGITALLGTMTKLIEGLASQKAPGSGNTGGEKRTRPDGCNYCSDSTHFINDCDCVLEDIKEGLVRRNSEGRVVLPSGAFVPKTITGKDLRARVKKWHEQNPGQVAATQLFVGVTDEQISEPSASITRTFTLSDADHMQMLQRELNALQTRAQAKRALAANDDADHTVPHTVHTPAAPTPSPDSTPAPAAPAADAPAPPAATTPATPTPATVGPQHPFANARDAAYAPPKDRNVGLPPPNTGPAYRTNTPVHNPKDVSDVLESCLNAPVTLPQRQIWSIAPDIRSQLREITTPRRTNPKDESRTKTNSTPHFFTPRLCFYNSDSIPDDLVVSMESSAIRSILPIIDNQQQVESSVDDSSQIIAMSEDVCHELALTYDPRIVLRMQSANKSVTPSLDLARNVPFTFRDITLYLQVHVVRNPAYDVLLGRPFSVLTQSIVRNFANEDQTITICDPNTGNIATIPTIPRGPPRIRAQGFPNLRN